MVSLGPVLAAVLLTLGAADEGLGATEDALSWHERGALVAMRPLAAGYNGMRVSGGFALALPFVGFEYARGVGGNADIGLHYEAVVGLLHFVDVGVRWAPLELGDWRLGLRFAIAYSFFGLASDNVNLTSTLFSIPELAASVRISQKSELILATGIELDLLEWRLLDGQETVDAMFRFDAALLRFGWKTQLTDELDVYVIGRIRLPRNAFELDDEQFTVVPFAEFGGTWAF